MNVNDGLCVWSLAGARGILAAFIYLLVVLLLMLISKSRAWNYTSPNRKRICIGTVFPSCNVKVEGGG